MGDDNPASAAKTDRFSEDPVLDDGVSPHHSFPTPMTLQRRASGGISATRDDAKTNVTCRVRVPLG